MGPRVPRQVGRAGSSGARAAHWGPRAILGPARGGCDNSAMSGNASLDEGPFFHGTRANLAVGDRLVAGHRSNYRPEVVMNHVYFTALPDGAGLAAEIAAMLGSAGAEPHVYL